jgi:ribosomal protein S18 acetylase RimI-like enzyme
MFRSIRAGLRSGHCDVHRYVWAVDERATFRIDKGAADPVRVAEILHALPDWFGIESAVSDYVEQSTRLPTYRAVDDDVTVGVCLVKLHSPHSAELYLIAVEPRRHRRGIGSALVRNVERDLTADGVEYLHVKTLGPSYASPDYERTRRFYEALGFRALEELHGIWPDNPCLIMVKHLQSGSASNPATPGA